MFVICAYVLRLRTSAIDADTRIKHGLKPSSDMMSASRALGAIKQLSAALAGEPVLARSISV
jgi:hypothetical protein